MISNDGGKRSIQHTLLLNASSQYDSHLRYNPHTHTCSVVDHEEDIYVYDAICTHDQYAFQDVETCVRYAVHQDVHSVFCLYGYISSQLKEYGGQGVLGRLGEAVMREMQIHREIDVYMSVISVYRETMADLLVHVDDKRGREVKVRMRENKDTPGAVIEGNICRRIRSRHEYDECVREGVLNMKISHTKMGRSSRGEVLLVRLYVNDNRKRPIVCDECGEAHHRDSSKKEWVPYDHVVGDGQLMKIGYTLLDAVFIYTPYKMVNPRGVLERGEAFNQILQYNKSTYILQRILSILHKKGKSKGDQTIKIHIPYRDSTLTRLLQRSLRSFDEKGYMHIISCVDVSDTPDNIIDILSICRYTY